MTLLVLTAPRRRCLAGAERGSSVLQIVLNSPRRAVFLPSTTRHYDYAYTRSLQFLVRCPPEIAWHVLGFWRCQYTPFNDYLGVH